MAHTISIKPISESTFQVTVEDSGTKTTHEVTFNNDDLESYGRGAEPEQLLRAAFEFLLKHEPKESILPRFNLSDIEHYFPDFSAVIRSRLQK